MKLRAIAALAVFSLINGRAGVVISAQIATSRSESSSVEAVATNAIAVADFEMAENERGSEDRAFGLADVLSVELRQRGVVLVERQQIRLVLAERRITASGLIKLQGIQSREIPALQYLVTGNLRLPTNGEFHLEVSLVEAANGRSVATFNRQGRYPDSLPPALAALAEQIVKFQLVIRPKVVPERVATHGLPQTPEVTLPFYRGVACCLAGRPELGIIWLRLAERADTNFLAARVWTVRAFEMLGADMLTQPARQRLLDSPEGRKFSDALHDAPFFGSKLTSVAVLTSPQATSADLAFSSGIRSELHKHTNLFVVDLSSMRALAAEMDLRIAELGSHDVELMSMVWSGLDVLVFVERDRADGRFLTVELRGATSGQSFFRTRVANDLSECGNLVNQLQEQLTKRAAPAAMESQPILTKSEQPGWPIECFDGVDYEALARLLKYVAGNLSDRSALKFEIQSGGGLDTAQRMALCDHYINLVAPDEPDAAATLSWALCMRHSYLSRDWDYPWRERNPSVATNFALLLERYPASLAAQHARSLLAMEHINRKEYALAAPLLLKLSQELPAEAPNGLIAPDYWAALNFFTGVTLHQIGKDELARQYLSAAADILDRNPNLEFHCGSRMFESLGENAQTARGQKYYWGNNFPERHPLFGPERNLRLAVSDWRMRMDPSVSPASQQAQQLQQLDALLIESDQEMNKPVNTLTMKFLRQLIAHKREYPALYQGRITEFQPDQPDRMVRYASSVHGWYRVALPGKLVMAANAKFNHVAATARTPEELATVRHLAREFAIGLDSPLAADCFEAVGDYEQSLKQVEMAISTPTPFTRPTRPGSDEAVGHQRIETMSLLRQKVRLLQHLGKLTEGTAYVQSCLPKLDPTARFEAAQVAARLFVAAGRPSQACALFADLARGNMSANASEVDRVAATYLEAEYQVLNGNQLDATELLRDVVKHSEGKFWHVRLDRGGYNLYDHSLERLAQLRSSSQAGSKLAAQDLSQSTPLYVPIPGVADKTEERGPGSSPSVSKLAPN